MDFSKMKLKNWILTHRKNVIKSLLSEFQYLAVVRAHISALGGNAMVSFYMTELTLLDNPHKNQVNKFNIEKYSK